MKNFLLMTAVLLALAGCGDKEPPTPETIEVTGVTLAPATLIFDIGQTETLTATVAPADAENRAVTWKSSAPAIAAVDAAGKVTAVAEGTATITVTTADGGKTADCAVTVEKAWPVTGKAGTLDWSLTKEGTLTVSGEGAIPDYAAPSASGTRAGEDAPPWRDYATGIEEIIISEGVTGIGANAFAGLTGLTNVSLPVTVIIIGDRAFAGCLVLEKINISEEAEISDDAFEGCDELPEGMIPTPNVLTKIPDAAFRAYCRSKLPEWDTDGDGRLSFDEAAAVTEINVAGTNTARGAIASLDGIEYFTGLTRLNCAYNQLATFDVSKNTKLADLTCHWNQLTSLDVSKNMALVRLSCGKNQMTSLDLPQSTVLRHVQFENNKIATVDVSGNTSLEMLIGEYNQITSLDVSKNTALEELDFQGNRLTSLDVSNNTSLRWLYCDDNQLTGLDVSNNTALKTLGCSANQLTRLDVSKNTALTELYCSTNQLTTLDVSKNTALIVLNCFANQLTSLDTYSNRVLKSLYCHDNPGNGYLFPVRSWFEYDRVPSDFTTENWWYDGNTILIAYGQVLVAIDPGIEFNGVIWATRNVGGSFRFVDDPKDPGAYMSYWSGGCPPGWRVPTAKEWTALIDASYIIVDGGATFGDPTNPVFLPAGGHEHGTTVYGKGNEGWYWTSDATIAGLYISFNRSAHTASYPWPNAGGTPAHSNSTGLNVRCVRR